MSTPESSSSTTNSSEWHRLKSDNPFAPQQRVEAAPGNSSSVPLDSALDSPIDAEIVDDHSLDKHCVDAVVVDQASFTGQRQLQANLPERRTEFVVPKRFGLLAFLGITTAISILFGGLRLIEAPPSAFIFLGLQAVLVCLAQMFWGHEPRVASTSAGMFLFPIYCVVMLLEGSFFFLEGVWLFVAIPIVSIGSVPAGAGLGYIAGTCAAGVFLLIDMGETKLSELAASRSSTTQVP